MTLPLLVLAGLDPTGGAGLIADAATARALGCYPLTVPTTLTVQNSLRFASAAPVDPSYIAAAIDTLADEFTFDTVKVGLVPAADGAWLDTVGALVRGRCRHIVIDPVLKATAAAHAVRPNAPFLRFISGPGTVITPNARELGLIADALGLAVDTPGVTARAVNAATGATVVVTFETEKAVVLIAGQGGTVEIPVTLVPLDRPVHGTGCRFSTAIACGLAAGMPLPDAVERAAAHLTAQLGRIERFHPDGQDHPL